MQRNWLVWQPWRPSQRQSKGNTTERAALTTRIRAIAANHLDRTTLTPAAIPAKEARLTRTAAPRALANPRITPTQGDIARDHSLRTPTQARSIRANRITTHTPAALPMHLKPRTRTRGSRITTTAIIADSLRHTISNFATPNPQEWNCMP